MTDILTFKKEPYQWLSNMQYVKIEYDGIIYPSIENFYQAMKYGKSAVVFLDHTPQRQHIRTYLSKLKPHESKKFSREHDMSNGRFEDNKFKIMLFALQQKFNQEPFKTLLLNTGDCHIEEGNWWGDHFWGVDIKTRQGENNLGKLIMQVRSELRG